jgi:glycerol-3-phosphate dehydrogenase
VTTYQKESKRYQSIQAATEGCYDIIIIGGGIHGAACARDASLRGFSTLLLEANDFAFGTSSRSSKMLHGGVRYLENFDFKLVREALLERGIFLQTAPHLCRSQEFAVPVIKNLTRPAWQIDIGLSCYDLLAHAFVGKEYGSEQFSSHKKIAKTHPEYSRLQDFGLKFSGLFKYSDGQMDDARLVIENIIDANLLGANTINYARVTQIAKKSTKPNANFCIGWQDLATDERYESHCRYLINAAGPWAIELHQKNLSWQQNWPNAVYSRGTHLLFDVNWQGPGLILPTGEKGRYYFVWPLFSPHQRGTLVGTTDKKVSKNDPDPRANQQEIEELLSYLRRDLPNSKLDDSTLYHTFCGMRLLSGTSSPGSFTKKTQVSAISRSESFIELENYISFIGGKFTNSRLTAEKLINTAAKNLGQSSMVCATKVRPLPGANGLNKKYQKNLVDNLVSVLVSKYSATVSDPDKQSALQSTCYRLAESAINRFGVRAKSLIAIEDSLPIISNFENFPVLPSELRLCVNEEFCLNEEDILRRRLGLSLVPIEVELVQNELKKCF